LIYSSNGKIGLGGFDLYSSTGNLVQWTKPENMGYPYNSSKDDLYFTATNALGTEGYISSDRESVCCLELFFIKAETIRIAGTVADCNGETPMDQVQVSLQQDGQRMRAMTDLNGRYSFEVASRNPVDLKFEKTGYFVKTSKYGTGDLAKADTLLNQAICLSPFKINVPIVLKNIYFDFNSAELNAYSMRTLDNLVTILQDNEQMRIELSAHTDSKGTAAYNLDLSERRANSCMSYLISKGIGQERVSARGYGEENPIAKNEFANGKDNPAGRQLNRRIEFKVTKNDPILAKARSTNTEKFGDVIASFLSNGSRLDAGKVLPLFPALASLVGNLAVREKAVTRGDVDSFLLQVGRYFAPYEKLQATNDAFEEGADRFQHRLQELQF
ncbi:MAG: hypothetical protein EOP49_46360, partial [Sphingobacteriales bacterium]